MLTRFYLESYIFLISKLVIRIFTSTNLFYFLDGKKIY